MSGSFSSLLLDMLVAAPEAFAGAQNPEQVHQWRVAMISQVQQLSPEERQELQARLCARIDALKQSTDNADALNRSLELLAFAELNDTGLSVAFADASRERSSVEKTPLANLDPIKRQLA